MRSPIQVRTQKKQPNQKNSSDSNANKPSSSSGNLRIKVRLSDNRTDIMELAKGTAVKSLKTISDLAPSCGQKVRNRVASLVIVDDE